MGTALLKYWDMTRKQCLSIERIYENKWLKTNKLNIAETACTLATLNIRFLL
jgi:hypothetical protein